MIYADLHLHTNRSDGLNSIEELLVKIKETNLEVIAITDHDLIFDQSQLPLEADSLKVISGVEMSCYDYDVDKRVHLLALNFDKEPKHIIKLTNKALKHRDKNHQRLIKEFNEKGYQITEADCRSFSKSDILFKSHLYQALLKRYPDIAHEKSFYKKHFMSNSKSKDRRLGYADIYDAIEAVHKDGGIAILAHPNVYDNLAEIEKYVNHGLDGLEVIHPTMSTVEQEKFNNIANKYSLIKSGGSDYHGIGDYDAKHLGNYGLTKDAFSETGLQLDKNRSLPSVRNFRQLGGIDLKDGKVKNKVLLRGGPLSKLSQEELRVLKDYYNLKTVVDFRNEAERIDEPNIEIEGVEYYDLEIIDSSSKQDADPRSFLKSFKQNQDLSFMEALNQQFVRDEFSRKQYRKFLEIVAKHPEDKAIYFHCTAGKDRTGFAAMLILHILGASKEEIFKDYLMTNQLMKPYYQEMIDTIFKEQSEDIDQNLVEAVIKVDQKYLEAAYTVIEKEYGNIENFIRDGIQLNEKYIKMIQNKYITSV